MPEKKLYQPHDRLIKFTYGRRSSAMAFCDGYLPPAFVAGLNFSEAKLRPGTFVNPTSGDLHTDLLYEIPFHGEPLFLYWLFEHQSKPDPWMGHRLLDYQSAIWREFRKENPQSVQAPPIYPIVLYSGKEPWRVPLRWIDKLALPPDAAPELRHCQVDFGYQLVNLSTLSAGEIRGDVAGRLTLSLMKAAAENRILEWLEQSAPLLKLLQQSEVTGMFEVLLRYLLTVDSTLSRETVLQAVERLVIPEFTNEAMSVADQLIEEGRVLGKREGVLEGEIRFAQRLLGMRQISDEEIASTSKEDLQRLARDLEARLMKR